MSDPINPIKIMQATLRQKSSKYKLSSWFHYFLHRYILHSVWPASIYYKTMNQQNTHRHSSIFFPVLKAFLDTAVPPSICGDMEQNICSFGNRFQGNTEPPDTDSLCEHKASMHSRGVSKCHLALLRMLSAVEFGSPRQDLQLELGQGVMEGCLASSIQLLH